MVLSALVNPEKQRGEQFLAAHPWSVPEIKFALNTQGMCASVCHDDVLRWKAKDYNLDLLK